MKIIREEIAKKINKYKNVPMMTDLMLHEKVFELIYPFLKNKPKAKILVLGAGKGAFERRLLDYGFSNITSVDIVDSLHKSVRDNVKFIQLDLNTQFSKKLREKFDVIVAIEVIEHLYSPYNFLKEVRKLIKNDGMVIVTSPNPVEISGTIRGTLFRGELPYFNEKAVQEKYGHISVITSTIMKRLSELTDFRIEKITYNRTYPEILIKPNKGIIWYFYTVLIIVAYYIIKVITKNKKHKEGVINIYVLRPK